MAVHQGAVAPVDRAHAYVVLQAGGGEVGLGGQHEARGVAVQAVHDARAVLALHLGQVTGAAVGHQGVCQGVVPVAARGVAHQAGLLGEHDDVLVFIADVERDVVGGNDGGRLAAARGHLDGDLVALEHQALLGGGGAVDQDAAGLDEAHGGAAAGHSLYLERGHQRVEALALLPCGDYVHKALCHGSYAPPPFASSRAASLPPRSMKKST